MSHEASIIADSVGPNGARVSTFQLRYPMKIHWDFMTHRAFARNASSGRVISVSRMVGMVRDDTFVPPVWRSDETRMRPGRPLDEADAARATEIWMAARDQAIRATEALAALGVHRQDANGLLVPFGHISVVVTATDWANFFTLRCAADARPEIRILALRMARAYRDSAPVERDAGQWHLPYVSDAERRAFAEEVLLKLSVARCARVSYRTHDGREPDPVDDDARLHDRLLSSGHFSVFEHQARAMARGMLDRHGNLTGWNQYRQMLPVNVHRKFDFSVLDRFGDEEYVLRSIPLASPSGQGKGAS